MTSDLSAILKKSEYKNSVVNLNELKDYKIVLNYPNKIEKGDIVLNAGLTDEISSKIHDDSFTKDFLSEVYGIYINNNLWNKSSTLYEIYKFASSEASNKTGLDRALTIANSVYLKLYYRMMDYTDDYSKEEGILTNADLSYLESNNKRDGKAIPLEDSLIDGPFLCHEFAVTLTILLNKEEKRTGLKPSYVMGIVERYGEKAGHVWIELRNRKGERILLDPISDVVGYLNKNDRYFISKDGIKYWIDNGPLILRKKSS